MTMTIPTAMQQSAAQGDGQPRASRFEYAFPALRGVQAGREFFVTMCPLRLIPRLFLFDEEELVPELRAQRTLNKARVPEIARYMVDNPTSYVFSALTASVDDEVRFEPINPDGASDRVGVLSIPMSAKFVINDGQHRRKAIEHALHQRPELGDESIAVVLFLDVGLQRCQQMFADLNRYAVRPSKSIGVLYDHREEMATLVRLVVFGSSVYRDFVEMEANNLSVRSRKLFTLSAIYTATKALLEGFEDLPFERRVDLARTYWETVAEQFPDWHQVRDRVVSAGEIRRDFIHSHGIVLHALGKVGNTLLHESLSPASWSKKLRRLPTINWSRTNSTLWEGRAIVGGNVSKAAANVVLTTNAIRAVLGLSLSPEEQRAEEAFRRGDA